MSKGYLLNSGGLYGLFELFKGNWILQTVYFVVLFTSIWSNVSRYIIFVFCLLVMLILPIRKYVDKTAVLLGSFSVFYCIPILFAGVGSWFNFASYLLCPVIFYIYGKYVVDKLRESKLIALFFAVSILLFSIVLYMSAIQDITQNGFVNITRSFSIWGMSGGQNSLSATLYGLVASLGLMGLSIIFVRTALPKKLKGMFLLLFVLSMLTVLHLVSRTGIVIAMVSVFCVSVYCSQGKIWRFLIVGLFVFMSFLFLFELNVIDQNVIDAYTNRNGGDSSVSSVGGRWDRWVDGIQNVFRYPLGWDIEVTQYGYAHNLWIDVARVSGILPFLCFLMVTLISYSKLFKLLKLKNMTIVPLLLGLNICFFLSSFVEPVIEAIPLYFYLYLMLWGIQNRVLLRHCNEISLL